jgi:hypothetical protein
MLTDIIKKDPYMKKSLLLLPLTLGLVACGGGSGGGANNARELQIMGNDVAAQLRSNQGLTAETSQGDEIVMRMTGDTLTFNVLNGEYQVSAPNLTHRQNNTVTSGQLLAGGATFSHRVMVNGEGLNYAMYGVVSAMMSSPGFSRFEQFGFAGGASENRVNPNTLNSSMLFTGTAVSSDWDVVAGNANEAVGNAQLVFENGQAGTINVSGGFTMSHTFGSNYFTANGELFDRGVNSNFQFYGTGGLKASEVVGTVGGQHETNNQRRFDVAFGATRR